MNLDDVWAQTRVQYYAKKLKGLLTRLATCTNQEVVIVLYDSRILKQEVKRLTTGGKLAKELVQTRQVVIEQEDDCDGCKI